MNKCQSTKMFFLSIVISGTILIQMIAYLIALLSGTNLNFNIIEVCQNTLKMIGLTSLQYAVDILVLSTVLFSLWKIGTQIIHTIRLKAKLHQYENKKLSEEYNYRYGTGKEDFIVISYPVPVAITIGFISPKIVLSTALVAVLSEEELEAVIFHEMYHKKSHDPLKLFLLSISAAILPYIPILKWFNENYRIIQEIMADENAIEKQQSAIHIGSALLKMLKVGKLDSKSFAYASFAESSVNYRIEYLLNPLQSNQIKIPLVMAMWSLIVFSLICIIFIYALI
ncbi:M56 family metallopeptidase [Lysinibacillus telephonicus]|uniref:M56 family metallopeptidase n=2 Tax=Lysinibacillus telephonicus TaxID=1714840 RepID=UPI0031FE3193